MNMMTHGIDNPFIEYRDSLSDQNTDKDKYSLVLANPPFKGSLDAESVSGDLLKVCKTKKTELLFLALFIRILKIGGRCACIVPDGVLFGSSKAHKDIRKEIVENQRLEAVISMPSGVFKPYAGVSTAILVFTKTEHGGTDNVWFYDMTADGFSLDDKRSPISENDIPDIIERFRNLDKEMDRKRTDKSFMVPKQDIVDNAYDTNFTDEILSTEWNESELENDELKNYKAKAEYYIRQHQDNIAIAKLKTNHPLTSTDIASLEEILWQEIGTKQDYEQEIGTKPLGEFVREIVGLDMNAAKEAFSEYLTNTSLDSRQIYFVNQIIEYIVHNGMMKDLSVLQESPFTDQGSVVEIFTDLNVWMGIRKVIDTINANAAA